MERALIIKKEWLDKILSGEKVWEMRSKRTKVRGVIGLIESGSGKIIGEADLCACEKIPDPLNKKYQQYHMVKDANMLIKYPYAWVLCNIKKYVEPIPYKHPKGAVIWVKLK